MFVISLVSGGAVFEKIFARGVEDFGDVVAVIVFHFVIVGRDDPRGVSVRSLERLVGFVEGVAVSIVVEGENLFAVVPARLLGTAALATTEVLLVLRRGCRRRAYGGRGCVSR